MEIITNPGAKYDASGGTAGILNIVLKKNRKAGYNGNIRAGVDERGKYNLGADINAKEGKVNVFASGAYNQRKSISDGTTTRNTFLDDSLSTVQQYNLHQTDHNVNDGYFAFGRLGLDYFIDNRNTLSVAANLFHGSFQPYTNSELNVDTIFKSGKQTSSFTKRLANTDGVFNNRGGLLSYKHNFPKSGEEFTANANYSKGRNENNTLVSSENLPGPERPAELCVQPATDRVRNQ